jgi:4-hydroxybenzoate polyprenyltransferase
VQTARTPEQQRIANISLVVMGGIAALILLTVAVAIAGVQTVWLSWGLLTAAIIMLVTSILVLRASLAAKNRARASDPSA